MQTLGPRPTPDKISFSRECFAEVGKKEYWVLRNPTGWGYPREFATLEDAAKAHAKTPTHVLESHTKPIMERVRWN